MFPLTTESKEATFAVSSMTPNAQLRGREIKGFWDNPYPHSLSKKGNSLDRKPSKRALKKYDENADV